MLKPFPDLTCLKLSDNQMSMDDVIAVRKVLVASKTLRELDMTNAGLDGPMAKELADGLI